MIGDVFRNGQKIFWISCTCIGTYIAYRYWKKRELLAIDEGFDEVSKVRVPFLFQTNLEISFRSYFYSLNLKLGNNLHCFTFIDR